MSGPMQYLHLSHVSPQIAARLAASPLVEVMDQSHVVSLDDPEDELMGVADISNYEHQLPSDPSVDCTSHGQQGNMWNWQLIRTSHRGLPNWNTQAHMFVETGGAADVYVLDTGVDITHSEFAGRASHSFVVPGLGGHDDIHGHGTHCAGTVAGGLLGIAKDTLILNVKVLGDNGGGSSAGIVDGIIHSHNSANQRGRRSIVSMSLGGGSGFQPQRTAIINAINDQVFFIVAAGNSNADTSTMWPAAWPETIAVGATDSNDNFASFSNHGTLMDIAGPGVTIWSAGATNSARCSGITPGACIVTMSGTSMSCPLVAGVGAQIIAEMTQPQFNNFFQEQMRSELTSTSTTGAINGLRGSGTQNRLSWRNDC